MLYRVRGGQRLEGEVAISGAKNSALALITAAALAAEGETVLENIPRYTDILDLCSILSSLGVETAFDDEHTLRIRAAHMEGTEAPYGIARKLRGSSYVLGLLLARQRQAKVAVPGGCEIGARPFDFHLKGFSSMGAEAWVEHGAILAHASAGLHGTRFFVDRSSFGTTINMMIAACLAQGTTVLDNAAREPEIVDLANFLTSMGAKVRGAGTGQIRIDGVRELHGTVHEVIPDRLEAGTYLMAGMATRGRVTVSSVIPEHMSTALAKLEEAGATLEMAADRVTLIAPEVPRATDLQTQPHPGFPTDLHPQFVSVLTVAEGISVVQETIFENRFAYTNELLRMGAKIKVEHDTAIVRGVRSLTGAPVEARDIRGGAALVISALIAEGETDILHVKHIERGYSGLDQNLRQLGADIERVKD